MSYANKPSIQHETYKLTAIVASSGTSFEVDVNPTITGIQLKQKIAEDTSIEMDHQVLFTQNSIKLKKLSLPLSHSTYNNDIFIMSNTELDEKCNNNNIDNGQHTDISYTISMPPHIYIFDKHHGEHPSISSEYVLNANDYMIEEEKLNSSPPPNLTSDEKLKNHPLFKNANKSILFQTLPKYEIEFDYHYNLAIYIKDECIKKQNVSKKYVKQIQHQYKSLRVLLKHFTHLKDKLSKQHSKFINKCDQQITEHQEYLNDFESDLTNLQSVELHASLQTLSRKTMLDVVDEGSFRNWYNKASTSQEKQNKLRLERISNFEIICNKYDLIKQSIHDIKRKKINFNLVQQELKANEKLFDEFLNIINCFDLNCKKVKNTINIITDQCESTDESTDKLLESISFSPTEMEKTREEQINIDLKRIKEINSSFYCGLEHIGSVQEAMVNEFTNNVSDITKLNGLISKESKTMDAYEIALDRKDQLFLEFVKLKALPSAYKACIDEIIRRRAFGILINNEINIHLNGIFNIFINSEITKRKEFVKEYGMLPVDLVNGLTKMPGNIKIYYNYLNEESLPIIDHNINIIKQTLCKEFEKTINEYCNNNNCKWKYGGNNELKSSSSSSPKSNGYHNNNNNIDLFKEQNKWKTEKLRIERLNEEKFLNLKTEIKKLESRNQDLKIELEQYKREEFPDPPNDIINQQSSSGFDGMNSEYIASQLSTILGASISNINPSALEQSRMFLSKIYGSNDNNTLIATNQVLQNDLDKLKIEMVSKENIIKKLSIENDKLNKQNNEYISSLDKLTESSSNLRHEMESLLTTHRSELEEIEIAHKSFIDELRENDKQQILELEEDIITYKNDIDKLGNGRTDLLEQIKILSDVSEEWEEKFNKLQNEYNIIKTEKEQKDNDEWMALSYLTNENVERKQEIENIRNNSIWLNGDNIMIGHNLLFYRDTNIDSYRAILNHEKQKNNIPVILQEDGLKNILNQLSYPQFLCGEVFQNIQRKWPQNIGQFKQGDPVIIVTAGCLKSVNFIIK